jgi:hypothetical protein|tara:strand:- start:1391 stop:1822 length:432 start_codon:yes stop_codon:yes gene_type:complete
VDLTIQLNVWWLIICAVVVCLVLLAVSIQPAARWWKYRQLKAASWTPHVRDIEGFGQVHVHPMPVPVRLGLASLQATNSDAMAIYLWLIPICIKEMKGFSSARIGMDFSPQVVQLMAEAVIDVAGLTPGSQADNVKKLEAVSS